MKDDLSGISDEDLIAGFARAGENRFLTEVVRRFEGRVYAGAYAVLRNRALAEEVAQESFLRVLMNAGRFRGGSFAAWLYCVTKNLALNALERQREEPLDTTEAEGEGAVAPEGARPLIAGEVRAILEQLDRRQRICLNLFYMEGLRYKEIAARTGYSEGAVKSYVQNGKKRFQKLWEQAQKAEKAGTS
jgi:RNA polymerase sigma-70 factor, ECF subfamily